MREGVLGTGSIPDLALRGREEPGSGPQRGGRDLLSTRKARWRVGRPQGALLEPRSHRSEGLLPQSVGAMGSHRAGADPTHPMCWTWASACLLLDPPRRCLRGQSLPGGHMACLRGNGPTVSTRTLSWGESPGGKPALWQELDTTLLQACQETDGFSNTEAKRWQGCCRRRPMEGTRLPWAAAAGGLTGGHEREKAACTGPLRGRGRAA